jgi:c(7)-type cytochrome triheme protein
MHTIATRYIRIASAIVLAATLRGHPAGAGDGKPELRLPPDHRFASAAGSPGPVVFSHESHVAFGDGKCIGCHPVPFKMLRPGGVVTHAEMDAGKQCGICHDGTIAAGTKESCDHCHGGGRS